MTVAELRAVLAGYPDDLTVVVDGYEGGFDDPVPWMKRAVLRPDGPGDLIMGRHEEAYEDDGEPVLVLARFDPT